MIKYLPFIILLVTILACISDSDSDKRDAVHLDGCKVEHCWIDENPNPTTECE